MDRVQTLRLEHRHIEDLADHLRQVVDAELPLDPLALLRLRRSFGQALARHLNKEDWLIYPRLKASREPALRALGARLYDEIGALQDAFSAYGRRWTSAAIAADWIGFRKDTHGILQALRRRIALEEDELYPVLERHFEETATAGQPVPRLARGA